MDEPFAELNARVHNYADARSLQLESQLGFGQDGTVFAWVYIPATLGQATLRF
jgi:hypothetical protein